MWYHAMSCDFDPFEFVATWVQLETSWGVNHQEFSGMSWDVTIKCGDIVLFQQISYCEKDIYIYMDM